MLEVVVKLSAMHLGGRTRVLYKAVLKFVIRSSSYKKIV